MIDDKFIKLDTNLEVVEVDDITAGNCIIVSHEDGSNTVTFHDATDSIIIGNNISCSGTISHSNTNNEGVFVAPNMDLGMGISNPYEPLDVSGAILSSIWESYSQQYLQLSDFSKKLELEKFEHKHSFLKLNSSNSNFHWNSDPRLGIRV